MSLFERLLTVKHLPLNSAEFMKTIADYLNANDQNYDANLGNIRMRFCSDKNKELVSGYITNNDMIVILSSKPSKIYGFCIAYDECYMNHLNAKLDNSEHLCGMSIGIELHVFRLGVFRGVPTLSQLLPTMTKSAMNI